MKKICLSFIVFLMGLFLVHFSGLPAFSQASRTIDHTTADIYQIPANWIDSAKAKLDIVYWRASHGTQLTEGGMQALMRYSPEFEELYNFDEHGGDGVLKLVEFQEDLEHQNDTWVATTEAYLAAHPEVNTVMWAWCGIDGMDAGQYLTDIEALIAKYGPGGSEARPVPVTFVFMNAHTYPYVDHGEEVYNKNKQILTHCEANYYWLFDFYDLECFDPDENYFGDGTPDRGDWNGLKRLRGDMSYDLEGEGRGNWGIEWIADNPTDELSLLSANDICRSCEHSDGEGNDDNSRLHCVLKGQAAWWLWARLAGWQEVYVPVTEVVVTGQDGEDYIDVNKGTLQMLAELLPVEASDKRVTWSVENNTGEATISSSGLLTAVENGAVMAVATSVDGNVRGDLEVTLSNQYPSGVENKETGLEVLVVGKRIRIIMEKKTISWEQGTLRVLSLTGAEVLSAPLKQGLNEIEIQQGPGIYLLVLQSPESSFYHKVFIQ